MRCLVLALLGNRRAVLTATRRVSYRTVTAWLMLPNLAGSEPTASSRSPPAMCEQSGARSRGPQVPESKIMGIPHGRNQQQVSRDGSREAGKKDFALGLRAQAQPRIGADHGNSHRREAEEAKVAEPKEH